MGAIWKAGLALLALAATAGPASPRGTPDKAAAVLAAAKKATGGAAWDRVEGSYEEGEHGGVPFKTWLDFRRYGMRMESRRGTATVTRGYDGETAWTKGPDGVVQATRDAGVVADARTTHYVAANGFFFPGRFPAASKYLRLAKEGGRSFDVLELRPEGGLPVELWFDRSNRRPARIVDRQGAQPVTVILSDYRPVGRVLIAFGGTIVDPSGKPLDKGRVAFVRHEKVPRERFAPGP